MDDSKSKTEQRPPGFYCATCGDGSPVKVAAETVDRMNLTHRSCGGTVEVVAAAKSGGDSPLVRQLRQRLGEHDLVIAQKDEQIALLRGRLSAAGIDHGEFGNVPEPATEPVEEAPSRRKGR